MAMRVIHEWTPLTTLRRDGRIFDAGRPAGRDEEDSRGGVQACGSVHAVPGRRSFRGGGFQVDRGAIAYADGWGRRRIDGIRLAILGCGDGIPLEYRRRTASPVVV